METQFQRQRPQKARTDRPNLTGIPAQMKMDFERRSGLSFDDVRVHYNSERPARLGALAYTQGTQVYVGPGQERHLSHELGHVVQQKRGLVWPTGQAAGLPLNDSPQLERMADQWLGPAGPEAVRAGVAVAQRQKIAIQEEAGPLVEIEVEEIKTAIRDTFKGKYGEDPIDEILANLKFKELTADMIKEGVGPNYEKEGEDHVIYYSRDSRIYRQIPDLQEDFYREGSPDAEVEFIKKAFIVTAIHEFGHAIQGTILGYDPQELKKVLHEHHNVLIHENLYPGRNRGAYGPLQHVPARLSYDNYWTISKEGRRIKEKIDTLMKWGTLSEHQFHGILTRLEQIEVSPQDKHDVEQQKKVLGIIVKKLKEVESPTKRESDFLKSLMISLELEPDTKKWFTNSFIEAVDQFPPTAEIGTQTGQ